MEKERVALTNFLSVHAHKIKGTPRERGVSLVDYSEMGVPLDAPLVFYDVEDLMSRMNRESTLVRFVLHRINTFDPDREALVGLFFDPNTVLIETLMLPQQ